MSTPVTRAGCDLTDRLVVVSGCTHGIGRATAELVTARGGRVFGLDVEAAGLPAGLHGFAAVDLADPASVTRAVEALPDRIDGLCNVAGVPGTAGTAAVRDVNYLGLRLLTGLAAERMSAGGSIASASSIAGSGWRQHVETHLALARAESYEAGRAWCEAHEVEPAYSYFKQALIVWTMHSAAAYARRGLRLNTVSPGPVETRILPDFRTDLGAERVESEIERVGRAGRAEEIAGAFAFLMSEDSAWINGTDLACDGGLAAAHATTAPADVAEVA